jgi:Concanavalin A-like lectin/glucanases superfamily
MKKSLFFASSLLLIPFFISAQLPPGAIAKYLLNTNANDIGGNSYNGTLTAVTNTTDRFGNSNSAIAFTAGSSTGTLPLGLVTAAQSDFSFGYWFKTSMVANTGTQWFNGNAMVDAEVCGATSDYGTALIDGGKVCLGIGNPDITIKSTSASYNNGSWHFVTATRNQAAGTIILYVDGVQVASSTGTNTGILNAPTLVGLARNPCVAGGVFTGSLDDIIVYNRVLSGAEVTTLYNFLNASTLPLQWLSFTGTFKGNDIELEWEVEKSVNNDHFEIEHSTDGIHFFVAGSRKDNESITGSAGSSSYIFIIAAPANGTHFYRIKQADKDGKFTLSKTIKMQVRNIASGLYVQSNPVAAELLLVNHNQLMIRQLQLLDASGKIVTSIPVNSNNASIRTDVQNLKPGYYLLRVVGVNGNTTLPLIKQ